MPDAPVFSVITHVRNMRQSIAATIDSVLAQTYPNVEYIVVDGASTDGTVELIRAYENRIDYWLSEPDGGPVDTANKGLALATGEFVTWVCGDDRLSPDQVERA